jgi:hypothetical protein
VQARGKSERGQKTGCSDVLIPVAEKLEAGVAETGAITLAAHAAADATTR